MRASLPELLRRLHARWVQSVLPFLTRRRALLARLALGAVVVVAGWVAGRETTVPTQRTSPLTEVGVECIDWHIASHIGGRVIGTCSIDDEPVDVAIFTTPDGSAFSMGFPCTSGDEVFLFSFGRSIHVSTSSPAAAAVIRSTEHDPPPTVRESVCP